MQNHDQTSGDAISQLLVDTAVLHAVIKELIRDPSLSVEVLQRASAAVEHTCDHFSKQPDKAAQAAYWKEVYASNINAAITHRR